jgi:regulatory protein
LTAAEVRRKLVAKALDPDDVEGAMAKLREYGYLDDSKFAEHYASMRKENQGLGKGRVVRDLRQRRVAPALAEKAVATAFEGSDEVQMIEQYLARKFRSVNLREYLRDPKHLASAFRRLQYAGFGSSASIKVLRRYADRAEELEDSGESEGSIE